MAQSCVIRIQIDDDGSNRRQIDRQSIRNAQIYAWNNQKTITAPALAHLSRMTVLSIVHFKHLRRNCHHFRTELFLMGHCVHRLRDAFSWLSHPATAHSGWLSSSTEDSGVYYFILCQSWNFTFSKTHSNCFEFNTAIAHYLFMGWIKCWWTSLLLRSVILPAVRLCRLHGAISAYNAISHINKTFGGKAFSFGEQIFDKFHCLWVAKLPANAIYHDNRCCSQAKRHKIS